ncbi:lipopolysaccharide biosynthesis protein [Schaalia suimastitidis]|uniref:lipopolysaccharide biosynthesis protein n=1 Tax=Schaalia suimastitidis TaxID=121163 RepID=UPI0003F910E7|nr:polysaccharide biosynthesis protein [Schaalia suimastitidis]
MSSHSSNVQLGRDYLWNTAASLMTSAATVIALIVVTRICGLTVAGLFSLGLAVGQQFQTLGMYEVRTYHVTDVKYSFSFGTYLSARILTVLGMFAGIVGYAALSGQADEMVWIIILVASLRLFDAFEDVFYCEFQRSGRLYIGARAAFYRTLLTTLVFSSAIYFTSDLGISAAITLAVSLLVMSFLFFPPAYRCFGLVPKWHKDKIRRLLIDCFPLALAAFFSMYLVNAPRFSIDYFLDAEQQGYFAILFMPAVAINMLALVVFRPLLTGMAQQWASAHYSVFFSVIRRGLLATTGAFFVVILLTLSIGIPVLNWLSQKNIGEYTVELVVLILGGAVNSAGVILYYALTTMRAQRYVLFAYLVASGAISVLSPVFVAHWGVLGAAGAYTAAMTLLAAVFAKGIASRYKDIKATGTDND